MATYKTDQGPLELGKRIDNTNRAEVYELIGNDNEVAKIFPLTTPDLPDVERTTLLLLNKGINDDHICLPLRVITDDNDNFVGYTMRRVPDNYSSLKKYIRYIFEKYVGWDRLQLIRLAYGLVEEIVFLNQNGFQVVDMSKLDAMVAKDGSFYLINSDRLIPYDTESRSDNAILTKWIYQILMIDKLSVEEFDLPLDDMDDWSVHNEALVYWYCLPFAIREAFYDAFKSAKYPSPEDWKGLLKIYKHMLDKGCFEKNIKPRDSHGNSHSSHQSVNLNLGDIENILSNADLRKMKNDFPENKTDKIGVLELSTKNVKLLVGKQPELYQFDFNDFVRMGEQPQTGDGLDRHNKMDMGYFYGNVIPYIKYFVDLARKGRGFNPNPKAKRIEHHPECIVDTLYVVATAAYRTARNNREIIELIRKETGVNVCILSKEEEADATMTAFMYSTRNRDKLVSSRNVLFIDQGGGSTEVSPYVEFLPRRAVSFNLGTNALKNMLMREQASICQALDSVDGLISRRLNEYVKGLDALNVFEKYSDIYCIAVGSAITNATGKSGSKNQHETVLSIVDLKRKIIDSEDFLLSRYATVNDLEYDLISDRHDGLDDKKRRKTVDNYLTMRLGLPIYVGIMEHFGIKELIVSGTGLWYGIYFQHRPIMLSNL